jgi:hypothetical protein
VKAQTEPPKCGSELWDNLFSIMVVTGNLVLVVGAASLCVYLNLY